MYRNRARPACRLNMIGKGHLECPALAEHRVAEPPAKFLSDIASSKGLTANPVFSMLSEVDLIRWVVVDCTIQKN